MTLGNFLLSVWNFFLQLWQGIGSMVATISRNLAELEKGKPVTSIYEQKSKLGIEVCSL
jgi:hypothetical protein